MQFIGRQRELELLQGLGAGQAGQGQIVAAPGSQGLGNRVCTMNSSYAASAMV